MLILIQIRHLVYSELGIPLPQQASNTSVYSAVSSGSRTSAAPTFQQAQQQLQQQPQQQQPQQQQPPQQHVQQTEGQGVGAQ